MYTQPLRFVHAFSQQTFIEGLFCAHGADLWDTTLVRQNQSAHDLLRELYKQLTTGRGLYVVQQLWTSHFLGARQ